MNLLTNNIFLLGFRWRCDQCEFATTKAGLNINVPNLILILRYRNRKVLKDKGKNKYKKEIEIFFLLFTKSFSIYDVNYVESELNIGVQEVISEENR